MPRAGTADRRCLHLRHTKIENVKLRNTYAESQVSVYEFQ